jgi:hypothetical protein
MSGMRIVIVTEDPPVGERDYAPKEFSNKRQIMTVLSILSDTMTAIVKEGGVRELKYAGRAIRTVTITQEKGEQKS